MYQVSRDHNLKIPKQIEMYEKDSNRIQESLEIKKVSQPQKIKNLMKKR